MNKQTKQRTRVQKLVAQTNWQKGRLHSIISLLKYEIELWERTAGVSKQSSVALSNLRLAQHFTKDALASMIEEVETIKPVLAILDKRDKLTSSETKEIVSQDTASKVNPPIDK